MAPAAVCDGVAPGTNSSCHVLPLPCSTPQGHPQEARCIADHPKFQNNDRHLQASSTCNINRHAMYPCYYMMFATLSWEFLNSFSSLKTQSMPSIPLLWSIFVFAPFPSPHQHCMHCVKISLLSTRDLTFHSYMYPPPKKELCL